MKCVIIQTAFLGDVVLSLPMVDALSAGDVFDSIDYVCRPDGTGVLETHPGIRNVIVYDKRGIDRGFRNFWKLVIRLRSEGHDCAVIPHRSIRSAALAWLAGISKRIGFDRSAGRLFLTDIVQYQSAHHEIKRNHDLLHPLGIQPVTQQPEIHLLHEDNKSIQKLWSAIGIGTAAPVIGIAPGSVWRTKRWPLERFQGVIHNILSETGAYVLLFGSPADRSLCEELTLISEERMFNLAGLLPPRSSAAAMKRLRVLLTNDSGAMHLAGAVGTPVAAMFGATVPSQGFAPWGKRDTIIERVLDCRPCGAHGGTVCPLSHFRCMKDITVEEISQTLFMYLEERFVPAL